MNFYLGGAWLPVADLRRAFLVEANLDGAENLTAAQVKSAKNWRDAFLPDNLQYLLKDPPPACPA